MPSISKLFIRIPKYISSEYIFDAINEMELCKVCEVNIKRGNNRHNFATVRILHWYKGSKDIRETLKSGGAMYIPCYGDDLAAYKYKSPKHQPQEEPDEFGRDTRTDSTSSERTYCSAKSDMFRQEHIRQEENAAAAKEFICVMQQQMQVPNRI